MNTVTVTMIDELTENQEQVVREICISNICVSADAPLNWEHNTVETNDSKIRKMLNNWISERANKQHNTILSLVSYKIN